jgi:hypothetical protein
LPFACVWCGVRDIAGPLLAEAALDGHLAGVLQEADGGKREAEHAGSDSREPRVKGGATRSLAVRSCVLRCWAVLDLLLQ